MSEEDYEKEENNRKGRADAADWPGRLYLGGTAYGAPDFLLCWRGYFSRLPDTVYYIDN